MNRKKLVNLVASFLMTCVVFGGSLTNRTAAMTVNNLEESAATSQCATSPSQISAVDNIFLSASNNPFNILAARTFQGCWSYFPAGQCRAIYREENNYFICGACSSSGAPQPGRCSRITPQTLQTGYWCS